MANATVVNFGTSASFSQTNDIHTVAILYDTRAWQNSTKYEDENFQLHKGWAELQEMLTPQFIIAPTISERGTSAHVHPSKEDEME